MCDVRMVHPVEPLSWRGKKNRGSCYFQNKRKVLDRFFKNFTMEQMYLRNIALELSFTSLIQVLTILLNNSFLWLL